MAAWARPSVAPCTTPTTWSSSPPSIRSTPGIDLHQLGVYDTQIQVAAKASALQDAGAEVAVDFTVLDAARENLRWCAAEGVHAVVGTTGFTDRSSASSRSSSSARRRTR